MRLHRDNKRFGSVRGFSLLEMIMAMSVFAVVATAMMVCFSHASISDVASAENVRARAAATRIMDSIRDYSSTSFETTYAYFNDDPYDDPDGCYTAPGNSRVVEELNSANGTAFARIEFPEVNSQLREDADNPELGMPRDLDADGVVGINPVDGTYQLLPVRVVVSWSGVGGEREYSVVTVITSKTVQR